jgi:hypothetical protein
MYIPEDILYHEIIKYLDFESCLKLYITNKRFMIKSNQEHILQILSNKFNLTPVNITNFTDFIKYGSIMTGSLYSFKYHEPSLCAVSACKFGNLQLLKLVMSNNYLNNIDISDKFNENYWNLEHIFQAATEGNNSDILKYLFSKKINN